MMDTQQLANALEWAHRGMTADANRPYRTPCSMEQIANLNRIPQKLSDAITLAGLSYYTELSPGRLLWVGYSLPMDQRDCVLDVAWLYSVAPFMGELWPLWSSGASTNAYALMLKGVANYFLEGNRLH